MVLEEDFIIHGMLEWSEIDRNEEGGRI